jgi:transposase
MGAGSGRRTFTREFKEDAVRLVTEQKMPVSRAAIDLGIHENTLHKWIRQYKADPEEAFPGKGRLKPQEEELRRLQRENEILREEREILKKALAIFSKRRR